MDIWQCSGCGKLTETAFNTTVLRLKKNVGFVLSQTILTHPKKSLGNL